MAILNNALYEINTYFLMKLFLNYVSSVCSCLFKVLFFSNSLQMGCGCSKVDFYSNS